MNIVFLCSLICLGSSISVLDKQLSPLKKMANKSLITSVTSSDLVKVIMDHKKDPEYLLSVLSNVDPTKLNDVLLLVRALLAASEADLVAVTQTSTSANTAYTDATTAYDAAVVARVDLQATKTAFDVAFTANSVLLDQQVAALLVARTEARGAKTNAQSTLDKETARLNGEIETLNQVISLLDRLVGSTPVSNIGAFVLNSPDPMTVEECFTACNGDVVVPQSKEETLAISELVPTKQKEFWLGLKLNKDNVWTRNGSPYVGWTNWFQHSNGEAEGDIGRISQPIAAIMFDQHSNPRVRVWHGEWYDMAKNLLQKVENYCICQA